MSDIFQIKGVNAELRIGNKVYQFMDPVFKDKIQLQKEWEELSKNHENIPNSEYLEKAHVINLKMIKQYLPTMSDEDLDQLGSHTTQVLLQKILELAEKQFGASVEDISKKK